MRARHAPPARGRAREGQAGPHLDRRGRARHRAAAAAIGCGSDVNENRHRRGRSTGLQPWPWTSTSPTCCSTSSPAGRPTFTSPPAPSRWSACAAAWSPLEDYPKLMPADTREIVYSILTNDQRQRLETDWQIDFAYSIPGHARFRVNAYFQRSRARRGVPPDPLDHHPDRRPRPAARRPRLHARSRAASCSSPARRARASPPRWRR